MNRALRLQHIAPPIYRLHSFLRAWRLERRVAQEQRYYRNVASALAETRPLEVRLSERLALRGLSIRSRSRDGLHILYATRPSNWEPHNIPPELEKLGTLTRFYYAERGFDDNAPDWLQERDRMNAELLEFVRATHVRIPVDIFLGYLSGWQISPEAVRAIGELGIVTCAFHWDDKPSFRGSFSGGRWSGPAALASAYDLNLTSAPSSIHKYEAEGGIAMFWPEAGNPEHFRPLDLPFEYDVSFIGACYGDRPTFVRYLERHGVRVATFGPGWQAGSIPERSMVEVYARSRINLGFGGVGYSSSVMCLKGRDFEVPMSGALYLTSDNPELSLVYEIGREILTYKNKRDCLEKICSYLSLPDRCAAIRHAARSRCLRDHTWSRRMQQVLEVTGFADRGSNPAALEMRDLQGGERFST